MEKESNIIQLIYENVAILNSIEAGEDLIHCKSHYEYLRQSNRSVKGNIYIQQACNNIINEAKKFKKTL